MYLVSTIFGQHPRSANLICHCVIVGEQCMPENLVAYKDNKRPKEADPQAVVFPAFPPLSCMVHTREASGPTSNSSSSSHPRDSQKPVKRPGATSISRTSSLPLLQMPLCPS